MKKEHLGKISIHRIGFASFIGTTIEWYDFFLYTYATTLVFAPLFFPNMEQDQWKALLYAFGANATGFLARPIGALVCGHFGDRIGRKSMLIFTLSTIGLSTFLIGCLPTYQTIGILAPILLVALRLAQGFAVGGEWAGAVLMAVEHAPRKRGFFGSYPQMGVPVGMLLATTVFIFFSKLETGLLINQGVWRIGFLSSSVLLLIGLYIRQNIDETQIFRDSEEKADAPIVEAFRTYRKNIFLAAGAKLVEVAAFYIYTAFLLAMNRYYNIYDATTVLSAIALASFLAFITIPIFGWVSDLIGRKKVYITGTIFTGLFAFPFFYLYQSGQTYLMTLGVVLALSLGHALMYGPQASFFSELFDTKVRYSGASMGYQISAVFGGGLFPLLAVGFLAKDNANVYIALILMAMAVISTFSVLLVTETFQKSLDDDSETNFQDTRVKEPIVSI